MSFDTTLMLLGWMFVASYGLYLIPLYFACRSFLTGDAQRGSVILAVTLAVAFGIPVVDHAKDAYDAQALKEMEIRGDQVDFQGKRILLISRGCGSRCNTLLKMTGAELVRVQVEDHQFATFIETNRFPEDTVAFRLRLNELRGAPSEKQIAPPEVAEFDLIVVHGERVAWTTHFKQFLPLGVSPDTTLVWRFIAAIEPEKRLTELTPEVLVMIQRDNTYMFPFHPLATDRAGNFDFDEFERYLNGLYCQPDNAREASVYCRGLRPGS